MSSSKALRYVIPTAVLALVANLAGCMHTSPCCSGCGVGLGQPVTAPGWYDCGQRASCWTANFTLCDRPSFNWCQKGQSCCTGAPMPDWVAKSDSMKASAAQPMLAAQPRMQESKKLASWMIPPVTPSEGATTIATASMTTAEKADVKPQAIGTGSSSMMVMDPMDGAKSREPIRRAIRRGVDRIQGNPTMPNGPMDFGMPADANAERIEKMPKEVAEPEVSTTSVKPVAFETVTPAVMPANQECGVSLQVFDLEDSVQQGSETAYLVQLMNEGTDEAKDLTITIHCPTNLRPISVLNAQQQSIEGPNVKVQVGDLAAGKTRIVRLNLKAMQAGDGKVAVTVTGKSLPGHLMAEDVIKVVR